jgi:hypothetical protein
MTSAQVTTHATFAPLTPSTSVHPRRIQQHFQRADWPAVQDPNLCRQRAARLGIQGCVVARQQPWQAHTHTHTHFCIYGFNPSLLATPCSGRLDALSAWDMVSGPKMVVYAEVGSFCRLALHLRCDVHLLHSPFLLRPFFTHTQLDTMLPYDTVSLHAQLRQRNKLSGVECVKLSDLNAPDPHNMNLAVCAGLRFGVFFFGAHYLPFPSPPLTNPFRIGATQRRRSPSTTAY